MPSLPSVIEFPEYKVKKSRGGSFKLGPEGRAICLYMEGMTIGSALGNLGMPRLEGEGGGKQIQLAEIGKIMDEMDALEEGLTGTRPRYNRLKRRFAAYMAMIEARNLIPFMEFETELAMHRITLGLGTLEQLQDAEDQLEEAEKAYATAHRENECLRKGKVYLKMISEFGRLMRERRVFS